MPTPNKKLVNKNYLINSSWDNRSEKNPMYGKKHRTESKIKMSVSKLNNKFCLGRKLSEKTRKKIREGNTGKILNKETKIRIGEASKERWKDLNYRRKALAWRSDSTKVNQMIELQQQSITKRWKDPVYREKMVQIAKNLWKNPEYRNKVITNSLKSLFKRPTSLEKILLDILERNKLLYKYTGNGAFLIGQKNPDFIRSDDKKICLEVYNFYHHPAGYEKERSEYFKRFGWKTIFINEDEIKDEDFVLNKLEYYV